MPVSLAVVTPPLVEPISLAEARLHLRIDTVGETEAHPDDDLIAARITTAREAIEAETGRALLTQTLDARFDEFADVLALPRAPVQSIASLSYVDTEGATQTLTGSDYRADLASVPPRIVPALNTCWPSAACVPGAITVRFVAGYGDAASAVPGSLRSAMLLLLGHLYENRTATVERALSVAPLAVGALCAPYRVWWL